MNNVPLTFPIRHAIKEAPRGFGTNTTLNKSHIMTGLNTHNSKQLHLRFVRYLFTVTELSRGNNRPSSVIRPISVRVHLYVTTCTVTGYSDFISEYNVLTISALKLRYFTTTQGAFTWNYNKTESE